MSEGGEGEALYLVAHAGEQALALPVATVIEIMRPRRLRPLPEAPTWLAGLATIRGATVPVVDALALLGLPGAPPSRLVTLRIGSRSVALACTAVDGVRRLSAARLPPLTSAAANDCIAALARADGELCVVLEAARLLERLALAEPTR